MSKRFIVALVIVVIAALVCAIAQRDSIGGTSDERLEVVASFYPVYFFASQIAGERAEVRNITPAGAEPHDFAPTAQDIVRIERADLIVLNGGGVEGWAESVIQQVDPSKVVVVSDGLMTLEEDESRVADPHVWLSPVLVKRVAEKIAAGYIQIDPAQTSFYERNLAEVKTKLDALDAEYRTRLASCAKKDFITSHAAFGYLAKEYGLRQIPIAGLSPEEEPSAQELARIADFAKENDVRVIFFESLVSPRLAETIASEIGAETLVLDPIEGLGDDDVAAGEDYFTKMRSNLKNLRIALQCS